MWSKPHLKTLSTITSLIGLFATTSSAQGRENIGYGVLDPKLTGIRPGYNPDQVNYWAPNSPSYVDPNLFEQQMVDLHNRYRSEHGVYPVAWDPRLVETAQQLVDTCVYGHSAAMQDNNTPYGENIYFGYETVTAGVERWGEERIEYAQVGFNHPEYDHALLHFTQMVWKKTNTIGCARKKCIADQNGGGQVQELWYVACHYYNRGNYWGEYEANVFPQGTPVGSR